MMVVALSVSSFICVLMIGSLLTKPVGIFQMPEQCNGISFPSSPQILRGKGLSRFIPSPDPTHVGASGTGSALYQI